MPSLVAYKGIDVVDGATGAGGIAITEGFKDLADRAPMLNSSNPGAGDDTNDGYFVGSTWLNSSTSTLWFCVDAAASAAVWKSLFVRTDDVLTLIPQETTEVVNVAGKLGIGEPDPQARLHGTESTIVGVDVSAVADGDLGDGQANLWVDESSGNEKLMFKVKLSSGTVLSGSVNLT